MPIYKKPGKPYLVKINYTDKYGINRQLVRQNKDTLTLAQARKVEAELLVKYADGGNESKTIDKMTFDELIEKYRADKNQERRKSSAAVSEQAIRLYIKDFFGTMQLTDIDGEFCQKWKNYINKQVNSRSGEELSVAYKNVIYKYLNALFNYAVKLYDLPHSPLTNIGRFKDSNLVTEELHYWTLDQFDKFSKCYQVYCENLKENESPFREYSYYTYFSILYYCGLRRGEAYCIRWSDIIEKKGTSFIKIFRSMNQKTTPFDITGPKNKSSIRNIPICKRLARILNEQLERSKAMYGFTKNWYVCGGPEPVKHSTLDKRKNRFAKESEIPQIRMHDFRHSFASLLINGNVNIKTISKLMGHATVQETWNRYGHLYPEAENEAISYIDKITDNGKISV